MKKLIILATILLIIFSQAPFARALLQDSNPPPNFNDPPGLGGTAPPAAGTRDFAGLVQIITGSILRPIVYLVFALALVYFLAGVLKYIQKSSDEKERLAGRQMMVYGIIAIAVMVSVWGLVRLVTNTFQLDNSSFPSPHLP